MKETVYLTKEELLQYYRETIQQSGGGMADIRDEGGLDKVLVFIQDYCCPLKVSEQRDIHPQCCCNGIADDFSEGKPLS